jgi:hypothetical protein
MKYTFVLPSSFDPVEFLPGRLLLHADAARWLMSMVLRKTANRDVDLWGCARLDSMILRRVMGNNSADITSALERGGAIETASYRVGVRCKGYRLARRYLGDRCVRVPCVEPLLLARLDVERQRIDAQNTRSVWLPIHHALDAEQRALSIDARTADAILEGLPAHTRLCQDVLVGNLRQRDFRFSVSSTGRVFNAITGLKRELREAVRLAGEPLGSVDLCCAQPALLAVEMSHETPAIGLKGRATYKVRGLRGCEGWSERGERWRERWERGVRGLSSLCLASDSPPVLAVSCSGGLSRFSGLALDGSLYEFLMQQTGLSRDAVKLALLRDVLAKRGRYPNPVEKVFQQEFPEVYSFIRRVNRNDHAELIRRLQKLESWLVIENVAPRLVNRFPIVSLHDAIYARIEDVPTVEDVFNETFGELGFRMKVKTENSKRLLDKTADTC